jgi:1-acyl-sn-glycerol-3-phosphate acyltransferase
MDPLILFRTLGRPTRPLAKAPLFEKRGLGLMLRAMGGLPVYRREDDPDRVTQNRTTFDEAVAALHRGEAVQIYPEGLSHSRASLAPLRTGAARIALQAEAERGWELGLNILPVGLNYRRKTSFRGEVVALVGDPIEVRSWQDAHEADDRAAVRSLTDRVREGLEQVTLNLESEEERELVEVAERIYAREVGLAGWRQRESLGDRMPRLQLFAKGAAWLRTEDPGGYRALAGKIRSYERVAAAYGAGDAEIPPRYDKRATFRYILAEGGLLAAAWPLAMVGTVAWLPVYLGLRPIVGRIGPAHEALSTHKLSVAALLSPLNVVAVSVLAGWLAGWLWGVITALAIVPLGLLAIAWHERWARVREDVGLFFRVALRTGRRERMTRMRRELMEDLERVGRAAADPDS